ncbi:MAG: prepilin-type N-terminal cleavage/methylation domain-containing protein [Candidatus Magasanikbacteria bacterium]|nr:prepilin-type N-terminal cleavage/methylation domain-containing protein [Candidatus Magasanikbacteria bacterium]
MKSKLNQKGFSLLEILIASAIFLLFALGVYSGINLIFKVVYQSRMSILQTALLAERLEVVRNLPYDSVGIVNGIPSGILPYSTTTVRNGQTFIIITTIRNIDDPFDGTLGGTPNDTSPADFKLVEMSVICNQCSQQKPITLSTIVSPKQLEGATQNGALFIQVFDSNGLPVSGANISITSTAQTPALVINDVTDNDGYLRIIDTPTGTLSYSINVSKAGYSADYTVPVGAEVSTPVKPPANVTSQTVTDISFSIDRLSNMDLHFLTPACSAVANTPFNIYGEKKIGISPDVYKYNRNLNANSSGNYTFANFEWDKYHISVSGTTYLVGGSTPMLPIDLTPGLTQDVSVILAPYSAHSLLVKVKDAGTGLPLSDATVSLTASGYDETRITGYGFVRQTDWSGGGGQVEYSNTTKYFNDNGNVENNSPDGDFKLRKIGSTYLNSGWLESSTIDLGVEANFNNIIFSPLSQPPEAGVNPIMFQLASSNSSTPSQWDFYGPDGASSTYYTSTSTLIWSGHNGKRYLRYKAYLNTDDTSFTPTLSEIAFTYITSCIPPGQELFTGLSATTYTLNVSHSGYTASSEVVDVAGRGEVVVEMSP